MNYLVDTHIALWWLADDPSLPAAARRAISDGSNSIHLSTVSLAEMAIKAALGKLALPTDVGEVLRTSQFDELPLLSAHAAQVGLLPWHHRDPFDRLLIAQAQVEGFTFITADARCQQYDVRVLAE